MTQDYITDKNKENRDNFLSIKEQVTATLYTFEEVQKIVENVREAVIKLASADVCYDYRDNTYAVIDIDNMRSLDLNQFINK